MNITIQTKNLTYHTGIRHTEEVSPRADAFSDITGNQDRLTLSSNRVPADDGTFARMLARRCADSIRGEASETKFLQIQTAVTDGTYRLDPARIAEKLLGHS